MTKLSEIPASADPVHLLIIGETKSGKSTFCAQAVEDGWPMIYVDSDNGLSALRRALKNQSAMNRVFYFGTEHPADFLDGMLTKAVFRWNLTKDSEYSSSTASSGDKLVQIYPSRIPKQIILSVDSWSAVALDAMQIGAGDKKTALEDMAIDNKSQQVYGVAGLKLTLLAAILQKVEFHTIVQAHPTTFEKLEKPLNMKLGAVKQGEMIIREVIEVPLSSSKPHGRSLGKFFTDIGWLEIDRADKRNLDFTTKYGRVSGGTINKKGPIEEMSFSNLFGRPAPYDPSTESQWIRYLTHDEFVAERPATPVAPKPAGVSDAGILPSKPANPMAAFMKK
jgi:hypothetical protein